MNEDNRNNITRTKRTVAKSDAINASKELLYKSYFSRLAVIADVIDRYIDVSFKDEVNWLKLRAIISLVTPGRGTMTPTGLARQLMRPAQNITGLLESLERDGLIVKRRTKKDRRAIIVKVTDDGLAYLKQSLEKMAEAEKELIYCLDETELETIVTMVRKITRHFVRLFIDINRAQSKTRLRRNLKSGHEETTEIKTLRAESR